MTFMDMGIFGLSFPNGNHPTPVFMAGVQQGVFDQVGQCVKYLLDNIFSQFLLPTLLTVPVLDDVKTVVKLLLGNVNKQKM